MPALTTTNATILVTGANGYIGAWIVHDLLKNGYSVRAAVRTESKGKHLVETFKEYGDKLNLALVGDIAADGAFDEAVKGVQGIVHTASPLHMNAIEPKDIIDPAVKGAVGILSSAAKNGTSVERVVITSSCSAVRGATTRPTPFSESDWNDSAVKECEEKGAAASAPSKYTASKTIAERAAWSFYNEHKSSLKWDLTIINPPVVFGPVIHEVPTASDLNLSTKMWYNAVLKGSFYPENNPRTSVGNGWVDVRDVSAAHVLALETPAAGGERIVVSSGAFVWQDFIDAAKALGSNRTIAEGNARGERVITATFDTSKAKRIFTGLKFRTVQDTARDTIADYDRRGW